MRARARSKKSGRATPDAAASRLVFAVGEIVAGRTGLQLQRELGRKWGVGVRQAREYVRRALKVITADLAAKAPELRAQALASLGAVYEKAFAAGDFSAACRAQEAIAKIQRLMTDQISIVRPSRFDPSKLTDEELVTAIALEEKAAVDGDGDE